MRRSVRGWVRSGGEVEIEEVHKKEMRNNQLKQGV